MQPVFSVRWKCLQEELVKQVNNISGISKLTYADGSLIAEVDNDLLRIPVKSDAISENVKSRYRYRG